ncbi:MAG: spermidine/putrescine ABC transporter substrate-binding protein [Lamprocystis purpurea]|jgi:spermidine/putrescine transport system substrate-binding protein|uniref:polyamine ABC transporter substrate-binding protein n=1 Tax=Lamprocystis purpurea TaxID=61598 RepID=UPI00037115E6|nr:spermidine/putrescine ABC transporter substrate-binding protein [Lamprocystis purpurea]MBV5276264.1 spermidine/putrescine ABC transporter substrate-binding protein [Lamprocystis purpurea]
MRRSALSLLVLLVLCAGPATTGPSVAAAQGAVARPELVVFNWPDYLAPAVIAAFEAASGARVRQVYFETDDARDQVLSATDGAGFDVLLVDSNALEVYRKHGWLEPLDPTAIPHRRHIDPRWDAAYPGSRDYGLPYLWGTMGIVYRRDLVGRELDSWLDLLNPAPALRGRILMIADHFDLFAVALKALGFSMNTSNTAQIQAAADLLKAQRPAVFRYGALALDARSELLTGQVAAAVSFNGDAAALIDRNDQVAYVVPREGGALWLDFLTVAARSAQPALAAAFLDFLNRPEIAARNARDLNYATPNLAAERLLPATFLQDPLVYPDPATFARCEFYARLPAPAVSARMRAYAALVHGD